MNGTTSMTSTGKTTPAMTAPPAEQQHPNGGDPPSPPGKANPTKTTLSDIFIYRMVVAFLGLTLLVTVAGLIWLLAMGKNSIPDGLIALGAATVGGLAGFLAPSPVSTSS